MGTSSVFEYLSEKSSFATLSSENSQTATSSSENSGYATSSSENSEFTKLTTFQKSSVLNSGYKLGFLNIYQKLQVLQLHHPKL